MRHNGFTHKGVRAHLNPTGGTSAICTRDGMQEDVNILFYESPAYHN